MSPFAPFRQTLRAIQPVGLAGRVQAVRGLTVSVADFPAPIGASCRVLRGARQVEARVIGFAADRTLVMPMGSVTGIRRGDRVICSVREQTVGVGPGVLGRVLDGFGKPIDAKGELRIDRRMPIWPEPMGPMARDRIDQPLATGVRVLDAMLTIGRGQRMGIFSGSGVGKSVLLGMIARYTSADVTVIALLGERGREVREFIERDLGAEGLRRSVVVACTSDQAPPLRVQTGAVATAVAEYFRDEGRDVLLLVDSLTRLATAQREIGLAAGEPPTTRGYTPSVFNLMPQLLERAGKYRSGSITAFYAVLVEGDEMSDPIGDGIRAVTDGHIHLSRPLASAGHYPAVDVLGSVSRVMIDVAEQGHLDAAQDVRSLLAAYAQVEDMVNIGAYQKGTSAEYDRAIEMMPGVRRFLAQGIHEASRFEETRRGLVDLQSRIRSPAAAAAGRRAAPRAAWRPTS